VKKLALATAALVAAVVVFVGFTLPPRPIPLAAPTDGTIPGIIHVHTNRSDGLSGPDDIAAAAARAGLKFLVFTDHGDATRKPDPPQYRSGVLCLDGVEISTSGGHYVALDMPASPFPLAGEARDVVEDVRRLGGFGIAAHPDSPKLELRWLDWKTPVDGVELLNLDTGWRLWAQQAAGEQGRWSARRRLLAALLDYPFRPAPVIAGLIRPTQALPAEYTRVNGRRVVAIAGADAHARIELRGGYDSRASASPGRAEPVEGRFALSLPGYESSFRVLSIHVKPERPFSGDAIADGRMLMRAIRAGHLYTAVDAAATPASFEFTAANEHGTVNEGDELGVGGPVTLRVRSNAPSSFTTQLYAGVEPIGVGHHEPDFTVEAPAGPAVYWAEVRATGTPTQVTWVRSNPIYVRSDEAPPPPAARPSASTSVAIFDGTANGWRAEHDPTSLAAVEPAPQVGGADLRFRFGLAGGAPAGQVAALAFDTPGGLAAYDRLTMTIRAERPMRLSVQLRAGDDQGPAARQRWKRTVYVDSTPQERTIFFDDLRPVGETYTFAPALAGIRSILFVVDATNTKMGESGRIWIRKGALEK
jgi:hypothetical protein